MKSGLTIAAIMAITILAFTMPSLSEQAAEKDTALVSPALEVKIPQMIDLGSKSCIPCKKMAPILEDLREKYKGKAEIVFIDTRENREAAIKYKITIIPTQVFFDTAGVETYRHIGFFPADSIITHLAKLGAKL